MRVDYAKWSDNRRFALFEERLIAEVAICHASRNLTNAWN